MGRSSEGHIIIAGMRRAVDVYVAGRRQRGDGMRWEMPHRHALIPGDAAIDSLILHPILHVQGASHKTKKKKNAWHSSSSKKKLRPFCSDPQAPTRGPIERSLEGLGKSHHASPSRPDSKQGCPTSARHETETSFPAGVGGD